MAPLLGLLLVLAVASARGSPRPDPGVCVRSPDHRVICGKQLDDFQDRGPRDAFRKICVENPVNHETVCGPVVAQIELRGFDGNNRAESPSLPRQHFYTAGGYYSAPPIPPIPQVFVPPPPPPTTPPPPRLPSPPPPPPSLNFPLPSGSIFFTPPAATFPPAVPLSRNFPKAFQETIIFRNAPDAENTDEQPGSGRMVAPPPEGARSATGIDVHGLENMPETIKTNLIRRVIAARKPALSMIIDCDVRSLSEEPLPKPSSDTLPDSPPPTTTTTEAPETPVPDARSAEEEVDPLSSAEFPKLLTRLHDLMRNNNTVKDEFGRMLGIPDHMNETAKELLGLEKQLEDTHRKQKLQIQSILNDSEREQKIITDRIAELREKQSSTMTYRYGGFPERIVTSMMSSSSSYPSYGMDMPILNVYRDGGSTEDDSESPKKHTSPSDTKDSSADEVTSSSAEGTSKSPNKPDGDTDTFSDFSKL